MNELSQNKVVNTLRVLYPIWFLFGIFSILYVPSTLINYSDPLATANNISAQATLFRLGVAGSLITQLLYIIIPFLLYQLFKKQDHAVAMLMLILSLVSVPITMYNETKKLLVLDLLQQPDQIMALLQDHAYGLGISTIFWGLWLFPLAFLVQQSGRFPKFIAIALYITGVGYVVKSFLDIVFPEITQFNTVLEIMTIGEVIFIFWFVIMGLRYNRSKTVE